MSLTQQHTGLAFTVEQLTTSSTNQSKMAIIRLTGMHFGRGTLVRVNAEPHGVNHSQLEGLAELFLAAHKRKSGYLRRSEFKCTEGDEINTRQLIRRLRRELRCLALVENDRRGGYRLATDRDHLEIDATFWELPPGFLDREIMAELRQAYGTGRPVRITAGHVAEKLWPFHN